MIIIRILAFIFCLLTIIVSIHCDLKYLYLLGFPDGHITELGMAERNLAYTVIGIDSILAIIYFYIGITKSSKYRLILFLAVTIVYVLIISYLFNLDLYYQLH